jgi:hypothetical protein
MAASARRRIITAGAQQAKKSKYNFAKIINEPGTRK